MNKIILIAAFFALLVSFEVVITALAAETFGVYMIDSAADGEAEKDLNENAEEDKNIEILVHTFIEENDILSKFLIQTEGPISTKPFLDQITPPPEA